MKTKRVLKTIGTTLIWVIFGLSLLTVILTLNTTKSVPNVFGFGYLTVQSDSMEPVFNTGDLIIVRTTEQITALKVGDSGHHEIGDVVTFHSIIEGEQVLNTHEIIGFTYVRTMVEDVEYETRYYETQGTNTDGPDLATITNGDIVAKYTGARIPGMGRVMDYIQTQTGFLITVVLPLGAIFIYQIINFVLVLVSFKEEKEVTIEGLTAEQKEEIAKKYLESLNKDKEEDKEEKIKTTAKSKATAAKPKPKTTVKK